MKFLKKSPTTNEPKNSSSYVWYRDSKMIGTILLLVIVSLQIFAWLQVPVVSTLHGYTIGMLFGYYNPFFYLFVAYFALRMIFGTKVELPKWLKLNRWTYWFIVLSFIFIGTSLFFYQNKTGWTSIGSEPWNSFQAWFDSFTSEPAYAPANTNGGIVGAFMYSLVASIASGIGAIIASIALAALSVSIVITGSFVGFYKTILHKRDKELTAREEKAKEDFFERTQTQRVKKEEVKEVVPEEEESFELPQPKEEIKKETPIIEDDFPFDDPFK